jgi:putative hydrolase of the HAD superfamily
MKPTLIIDADDTLWQSEIYYEDSILAFVELMVETGFDAADATAALGATQRERVPVTGYSPQAFADNLAAAYERLCSDWDLQPDAAVSQRAVDIGSRVIGHPVEPLDGVDDTLRYLRGSFQMIVLTKGDREEQEGKLRRSGLASMFDAVHVVHEKDADVLRSIVTQYGLDPGQTWMIGNSPKSDINPAVKAGIGAIYVPHTLTWDMEQEEIADPSRVTELRAFGDLVDVFSDIGGASS